MEAKKTGTTTIGIKCKDGVVIAADRQSTMGNLVSSKTTDKVFEITRNIGMTIAGTAGDGQALARLLRAELKLYELQEREASVRAAATLMANILRSSYKNTIRPDLVQIVIGGWDSTGGPQLYSIDLAGAVEKADDYTFTGSGSPIALGVLEEGYRPDITTQEAVELIAKAIRAARERDVYTGGKNLAIATITEKGFEWVPEEEIKKLAW